MLSDLFKNVALLDQTQVFDFQSMKRSLGRGLEELMKTSRATSHKMSKHLSNISPKPSQDLPKTSQENQQTKVAFHGGVVFVGAVTSARKVSIL